MSDPTPSSNRVAASAPEDSLVRSKSPEGVRRMFSDIAPTYDFLNHFLSGGVDLWWRRVAARSLVSGDVGRILDICSGTGDLALALAARASRVGAAPLIVASDFTPAMMRLAGPKFLKGRNRVPHPSVGDALHLPFGDSAFDLVTVAFGIRNVADLRTGLEEMVRV
ncbi:MAG: class I SAM-dependent methyltransferase, partial [Gemmatimonadetes bacterium]|nr:class I SAM-dependent methyltransferase [Gemmatimonadota bacterium]